MGKQWQAIALHITNRTKMDQRISLRAAQVRSYQTEGFLIIENVLSEEEVDAFVAHQESCGNDAELGLLTHTVDPLWKHIAHHPNVAGVAAQLLEGRPRIVQSMYLPKKAGEDLLGTAFHQDTRYLPTEPNTLMGCWIAMSDTGPDNGGLCVAPGSHLAEMRPTHLTSGEEHHRWTHKHLMRDRQGKEWNQEMYAFEIDGIEDDSLTPLEVRKCGAVFFTGLTIHGSYANRSVTRDRVSFAVHYVKDGSWVFRADVQETVAVTGDFLDGLQ
jgi:hypothetical protein